MKNPGCGGCPPCCKQCVFDSVGEEITGEEIVVQTAANYDCKQGFGDIVKNISGRIGQTRKRKVHFLSESGIKFLQQTNNPLLKVATA